MGRNVGSSAPHLAIAMVFDEVRYDYPKFSLGPINVTLNQGVTALLGSNGAGKTTLMELAVGMLTPQQGTIRMSSTNNSRFERPGYLPQDFAAPPHVTVREFLDYAAWCRSSRKVKISDAAVTGALESVDLLAREHDKIGTLSGGMKRRLGLRKLY